MQISIGIFKVPGCMESAVMGIKEIFGLLNRFTHQNYFEVKIIDIDSNSDLGFDYLIIPPLVEDPFKARPKLVKILQKVNTRKTVLCSVCSGSFQFAHSDIVGKRKVTTHWGYRKEFNELFPAVKLDVNELIIEDQGLITSAGIMAYVDLCLYIIKRSVSPLVANQCSKLILFSANRTKQSPYIDNDLIRARNDQEKQILKFIETNLSKELTIKTMADLLGMHERTFLRWFKLNFQNTPLKFINAARFDKAKTLLSNTNLTINEICFEIGYLDTSSFRRNFKKFTGLSPSEFRNSP